MSVQLIVNPSARGGRARKQVPQVVASLRETFSHRKIAVHLAGSADHARLLIDEATAHTDPADAVVVMGGDGMMHLAINAVAGTSTALGLIPAGSGNDLCRGLGFPIRDLAAVLNVLREQPRPIDAMKVDSPHRSACAWVGSILATGFDAAVNVRANRMRFPKGPTRYPAALVAELLSFKPIDYDLVIDGERRELAAMLVAIGNTSTYGGGIAMCPDAHPDDGWLDVTIIHPASRATLVRVFAETYSGRFTRLPQVEQLRAKQVTINATRVSGDQATAMGDGEVLGPTPLTASVVPGAVSVFRPAAH